MPFSIRGVPLCSIGKKCRRGLRFRGEVPLEWRKKLRFLIPDHSDGDFTTGDKGFTYRALPQGPVNPLHSLLQRMLVRHERVGSNSSRTATFNRLDQYRETHASGIDALLVPFNREKLRHFQPGIAQ